MLFKLFQFYIKKVLTSGNYCINLTEIKRERKEKNAKKIKGKVRKGKERNKTTVLNK